MFWQFDATQNIRQKIIVTLNYCFEFSVIQLYNELLLACDQYMRLNVFRIFVIINY